MGNVVLISADRTSFSGAAINVGDALLTDALAEALTQNGHNVRILDFGSTRATPDQPRERVEGLAALLRSIKAADFVVVGGGTMIQQDSDSLLRGSLARLCVVVSLMARACRVPLAYFAVGVDPLPRRLARIMYRVALWRREMWVRDRRSQQRAVDVLGVQARLAADAALLLPGRSVPGDGPLLIAPNRKDRAQVTTTLQARLAPTLLVAMSHGEINDLDGVAAAEPQVGLSGGWRGVMDDFARSGGVIASRMHALYIGLLLGLPMIAIGDSAKVKSFAEEFGLPWAPSFDQVAGTKQLKVADAEAISIARARVESGVIELSERIDAFCRKSGE